MQILMIGRNDPASMMITFANALNKYSKHSARVIAFETRYAANYENDILVSNIKDGDYTEIEELLKDADVFHFHMCIDEHAEIGPLSIRDFLSGKAVLHHHHGHPDFRARPNMFADKYRHLGRRAIVATPDLLELLPEATWQPNMVPLNNSEYLPGGFSEEMSIEIAQAPTRKYLKNTKELENVVARLQQEYGGIALRILENISHQECLAIKRQSDIVFDHMQGYFGISSLESLSQGRPVIAGLDDFNIKTIKEFTGVEEIPWVIARNESELEKKLRELISDSDLRRSLGSNGRAFMERHWTEEKALEVLLHTYNELF